MTTETRPVDVIVTCWNHEQFVEQALTSLDQQTFTDFNVIVVDDASSDRSRGLIRAWAARTSLNVCCVENERNIGLCASLNRALAVGDGVFVSHLSADDAYEPEKLGRQYAAFIEAPPSVALVYSDVVGIDIDGNERERPGASPGRRPEGRLFETLLADSSFIRSAAVTMRRSAIEQVGGFDEALIVEDLDIWLKLADRYEFRYCPGALARYRVHTTSVSRSLARRPQMIDATRRVLAKYRGRSTELDAVLDARLHRILRRHWAAARRRLPFEAAAARAVMTTVYEIEPTARRRAFLAVSRLPGLATTLRPLVSLGSGVRRFGANLASPRS